MDCNLFTKGKINLSRLSGTGTWTLTNTTVVSGKKTLDVNNHLKVSGLTTLSGGAQINTKVGFYGTTPITQPIAIASASTASGVITQFNLLLQTVRNLGLIAT